jgi:rhamnose utilization protein RhaD (predicted bifunctional aldolase and dehydrogenase)
MSEIKDLVEMSKYAGERFDLIQAGGGNCSVKFDNGEMVIKASGFLLSELTKDSGYSRVFTKKIAAVVKNEKILNATEKRERESLTSRLVKDATIDKNNRPSIETLLHSFLLKYTLHTHPIVVNMIVIQKNWEGILNSIFVDDEIVFVEYKTPGIELALALDNELKKFETIPNIIFLQNHGLIVTSADINEIKEKTEYVLEQIETYLKIDMSDYKITNEISYLFNSVDKKDNISYLSEDRYLNGVFAKNKELFFKMPFCPDSLVYCGIQCVEINDIFDVESIKNYKEKNYSLPKVVVFKSDIYFIAQNIKKAKEMEEVFKFHIMVLEKNIKQDVNFLGLDELAYLSNWEAEQYRSTK